MVRLVATGEGSNPRSNLVRGPFYEEIVRTFKNFYEYKWTLKITGSIQSSQLVRLHKFCCNIIK
jgi:hypothetical protein